MSHVFVDYLPDTLEDGIVYVSIPFDTVVHRCCCGCGLQVVTPLSPTDWRLTYDGRSISLYPSIGNWDFPCRSHYWITAGRVEWARMWSAQEVERARDRDRRDKVEYFDAATTEQQARPAMEPIQGIWQLLRRAWSRWR